MNVFNKICTKCLKLKSLSLFSKQSDRKSGYRSQCKQCQHASNFKWRQTPEGKISSKKYKAVPKNKARSRDIYYQKHYGISLLEYDQLFKNQGGCCAICVEPQSTQSQLMHVDHDHKTGKVRGLLCVSCNRGLGLFKDNSKLLLRASNYLVMKDILISLRTSYVNLQNTNQSS